MLINRGRGYQNLRYLLLKAKRMAVSFYCPRLQMLINANISAHLDNGRLSI
jgi:hypothetical protein